MLGSEPLIIVHAARGLTTASGKLWYAVQVACAFRAVEGRAIP